MAGKPGKTAVDDIRLVLHFVAVGDIKEKLFDDGPEIGQTSPPVAVAAFALTLSLITGIITHLPSAAPIPWPIAPLVS
jgi:hypothetical protein